MTLKDRMSQAFYRHKGPEAMVAPTTDELQNAEVALDEEQDLEPPATVVIVGCGQRGWGFAKYVLDHPKEATLVAVADPIPERLARIAATCSLESSAQFSSWADLLQSSPTRVADAVVVAVQDHLHREVVIAFAARGYHILCEKPLATSAEECVEMGERVKEAGIIFGVGHVLRYSPYTRALVAELRSRSLGDLLNVIHMEPIGHFHFAHSYVRGNWSNSSTSSFGLLTKSCHDLDIILHFVNSSSLSPPANPKDISVHSFGHLSHFKPSNRPPNAALRCLDCPLEVERNCAYSAKKIYLERFKEGHKRWPVSAITPGIPDLESVMDALQSSRYGECVYLGKNDIVDHQVVNLQFPEGQTVSFTMVAFTSLISDRQTRLHFAHGEIIGDMSSFTVRDFRTGSFRRVQPKSEGGGHGGGDDGIMRAFLRAVRRRDQGELGCNVDEMVMSHLLVFAAEESRLKRTIVNLNEFEARVQEKVEEMFHAQTLLI
ncbi:NAD(P)-binding protein [Atractiella rhizophila]|nr:NAD(P)-binding protein [Atractiella rhizophila]